MRRRRVKRPWTKQEIQELRVCINTHTNEELCNRYATTTEELVRICRKYRIQRDKEVVKELLKKAKEGENNPNWKGGVTKDHARYLRIQRERYPEHKKARDAVYEAVKKGILIKPEKCSECGKYATIIEGHHESYEKEKWLDVTWLCKKCHRKRDSDG